MSVLLAIIMMIAVSFAREDTNDASKTLFDAAKYIRGNGLAVTCTVRPGEGKEGFLHLQWSQDKDALIGYLQLWIPPYADKKVMVPIVSVEFETGGMMEKRVVLTFETNVGRVNDVHLTEGDSIENIGYAVALSPDVIQQLRQYHGWQGFFVLEDRSLRSEHRNDRQSNDEHVRRRQRLRKRIKKRWATLLRKKPLTRRLIE